MRKTQILASLFLLSSLTALGQNSKGMTFDIADFNEKLATAAWLYVYDAVAWWTSDSIMTHSQDELLKLGNEWFCFQTEDNNWHAVYGKYENDEMDVVFHYLVDTAYQVSRIYEPIDTIFLNKHVRALITANKEMVAIRESINLRFNQYIKQNEDNTFTVWIFPAFQPNGVAVYGGEFIYEIDPTGMNILENKSYYQGQFRGFKVDNPREVWMDYTELENPTLGTIFFIWYYKKYFTYIKLDNKNYITTAIKDSDGNYSWVHIEKEAKKKTKE